MFGRPRCREWTPLATQQLRLRSLIQIVGYNIRPPEWCTSQCSFYLTLHHTSMSAPFYTSERISSPHPKWKEIDSEMTQSMSSTNVIIRIWCHTLHPNEDSNVPQDTVIQTWGVYFSGMRYIGANLASNFTSDCFKTNTLVFQMHGGYFCSYKSLKLDVIPHENELDPSSLSSDSSGRTNLSKITLESKFITTQKLLEGRSISPNKHAKADKEYSKSHSPIDRGFQKNFPSLRQSSSINIGHSHRDLRFEDSIERSNDSRESQIYEHSPENLYVKEFTDVNCDNIYKTGSNDELSGSKIDLSETAESYDLRNETDGVPKYRYMSMNFLKSEIRPSYNATKLQKLHILQYSIKKRQDAVQEIKEKIYKKSALTDSWSEPEEWDGKVKAKSRSQRNLFSPDNSNSIHEDKSSELYLKNGKIKDDRIMSNGPRLTLKLNDLLTFKTKPSPFQRAEHVRLTKQLEILRFKRIILSDERDSKLANIRRLKERHTKLSEENQDVGLELMEDYHSLSRRTEVLRETRQSCAALRELAARSHAALSNRRCELLNQLHQIFYIDQKEQSWSIIGVQLPVCGDENPKANNPVRDSVAAGFVAQATCLAAALLNQPLRYKITLLGSATKILDVTPDLPDPNIPLFARGGDLTLFRYALFLMNKCIAQLLWGRGLHVTDIRPTLANLQRLLTTPTNLSETSRLLGTYRWVMDSQCPRTQSLRSLVASDRGKYRPFNRFKDSVDGQPPQMAMNSRKQHRHCRSVGSYNDDQELPALDTSTTSIMGSESNIYNIKLDNTELTRTLKSTNSDSAILTLADDRSDANDVRSDDNDVRSDGNDVSEVSYVIGDDAKLVRISTNNGDEITYTPCLDENVKRICSEISTFCSEANVIDVHKGFDIAKHMGDNIDIAIYMEGRSGDIEDVDVCATCEMNKDGVCDMGCVKNVMTDVIVIPSAEAILDTGHGPQGRSDIADSEDS